LDANAIQKLADSLGTAVDSIWQMKPAIVQQHVYNSVVAIIVGLIFLVIAFFVCRKYCNCNANVDDASITAFVFCIVTIATGSVLFLYSMFSFVNWTTAPDVCFINYIMSLC
jgi:hypothetical protein